MIKAAIEKILSLAKIENFVIGDKTYTDRSVSWVRPSKYFDPYAMNFSTLTGMVDFIKAKSDEIVALETTKDNLMIVVDNPSKVSLYGRLQEDNNNTRFLYAESKLVSTAFSFGNFIDLETFVISLQSQFVQTPEVVGVIGMIGNLANEHVVNQKDDGFSQKVQISNGITTKSEVKVENPVMLQPYRTFREINQPKSSCLLRFKTKSGVGLHVGLFISDGDAWKLTAMQSIKSWLEKQLDDIKVIA